MTNEQYFYKQIENQPGPAGAMESIFGPRILSMPTIRIGIPRSFFFDGNDDVNANPLGDDQQQPMPQQPGSLFNMMPRFGGVFDDMFSGMRQRMDSMMETMRRQTDALSRGEIPEGAGTGRMVVIKSGPG